MNKLIYRNQELDFNALFMEAAMNHTTKLTFITREEYLAWVKQWKEDYKNIVHLYTIEKWEHHPARLPERIKYFEDRVKALKAKPGFWAAEVVTKRVEEIKQQILTEYSSMYVGRRLYAVVMYLLVARKAGKIRANTQRNLRLLAEANA
jgi:hypothetical protein